MNLSDKQVQGFEKIIGLVGLGIIVWMIYRLGPSRIAMNLQMVSWGFFWMFVSRGFRYLCQTVAWELILAQEQRKVSFWRLFRLNLEGECLNYITITKVGGEAVKAVGLSGKIPLAQSAASVIVLKFCNIFGFWLVITIGFLAIFFSAGLSADIARSIAVVLVGFGIVLISASRIQRKGMFRPLAKILEQFQSKKKWVAHQVLRLTHLDNEILETHRSKKARIIFSAFINAVGWVEEIFFIWLVLHFLKVHENWFLPTLIGTISLLLNAFFFFVPWRAGTQEGTTVFTFTLLNLSEPMGLSLAILRRLRELVWIFIGLTLFALEAVTSQPKMVEPSPAVSKGEAGGQ